MLALVACVAVNIWCFQVSTLLGIIGLNVTKHVMIAQLCQALGVNRKVGPGGASLPASVSAPPPAAPPTITPV
jgi:hypothetical protein